MQESILEAYRKVDNLDERTKTKRKNRTVGPGSYKEELFQDNNTKKGESEGIRELPYKQSKILKVAEVCGVKLPNADRSRNYTSGTFGSCGIDWCREQYNTNTVLLDAVSLVVVGLTHM